MDLKSFGEEEFDTKKWINKAWSTSGNQDKEVFVANTVSRLQLYMKQLTNSLDETTTQIVTSIPRVLHDASSLQVEGSLLQQQLLALEQKVLTVEEETGQSISSLQRIDQLKSRLENAASALREADKWAALATALEDVLESGVPTTREKVAQLTDQVTAMTASLEVLSEDPDYEHKRIQLETLYNRLEAAVSAPLIDALTQVNAEKTASYVALYKAMGRSTSLLRSWRRAAASSAAAAWQRLDAPTLAALQATLQDSCSTQVEWLSDVLKCETPLGELVRLYTDLLLSLEPSPSKVLSANLKLCGTPHEGIELLTDIRTELDQLKSIFTALLETPGQNKEKVLPTIIKELGKAIYGPLRELLPKYSDLQTQVFSMHVDTLKQEQEDLLERSRSFQNLVERSESWLNNAHGTGRKIAGSAIYPYFVPAVEAFTSTLTMKISTHTRRIETEFLSSSSSSSGSGGVLSRAFPGALALAAAAQAMLNLLAALLSGIHEKMASGQLSDNPLHNVEDLLLDDAGRQRLTSLLDASEPISSVAALRRESQTLKTLAVNILRDPVHRQLDKVPSLPVWSDNDALSTDLPDFALSPQEYMTQIGQYLMTLPQHLEMYLPDTQAPFLYLSEVCNHTCTTYAEKIVQITNMDALGTRRCLTDIQYLCSVVEDLGGAVPPQLTNLERSLRQ